MGALRAAIPDIVAEYKAVAEAGTLQNDYSLKDGEATLHKAGSTAEPDVSTRRESTPAAMPMSDDLPPLPAKPAPSAEPMLKVDTSASALAAKSASDLERDAEAVMEANPHPHTHPRTRPYECDAEAVMRTAQRQSEQWPKPEPRPQL